jgi:hypothetical protein
MEQTLYIPFCPPVPNDTIPMLVVVAVFVLGGWLIRRWRKKRSSKSGK